MLNVQCSMCTVYRTTRLQILFYIYPLNKNEIYHFSTTFSFTFATIVHYHDPFHHCQLSLTWLVVFEICVHELDLFIYCMCLCIRIFYWKHQNWEGICTRSVCNEIARKWRQRWLSQEVIFVFWIIEYIIIVLAFCSF